jgi:hypothetical protein
MRLVILAAVVLVAGCRFATAPDPCPTPPEQHPESWTAVPVKDATGTVIGTTYLCGRQR